MTPRSRWTRSWKTLLGESRTDPFDVANSRWEIHGKVRAQLRNSKILRATSGSLIKNKHFFAYTLSHLQPPKPKTVVFHPPSTRPAPFQRRRRLRRGSWALGSSAGRALVPTQHCDDLGRRERMVRGAAGSWENGRERRARRRRNEHNNNFY